MGFLKSEYLAMSFTSIAKVRDIGALRRLLAKVALVHVVPVQLIAITEFVIEIGRALVNVNRSCRRTEERRRATQSAIGLRNEVKQRLGNIICPRLNRASSGIVQNLCAGGQALTMTQPFIAEKKVGRAMV